MDEGNRTVNKMILIGKAEVFGQNCPSDKFSTKYPVSNGLELNLGLYLERVTTDRMSHGTADTVPTGIYLPTFRSFVVSLL
jgi:hypothetical protein